MNERFSPSTKTSHFAGHGYLRHIARNSLNQPREPPLPIFHRDNEGAPWQPSDLARGPFTGLQGGAVAGLLTAEVERIAATDELGTPVHLAVWFLRPAPLAPLRTRTNMLQAVGRVSLVEASLHTEAEEAPLALARVTVARPRKMEITMPPDGMAPIDPTRFALRQPKAPHGGPWFMDAMEYRQSAEGTAWFRMTTPVVEGAGPLAALAGPADWTHGIGRPLTNVAADPNSNLNIHLLRPPRDGWIGISALAKWLPDQGTGFGRGILLDVDGEIGSVSMSVMLTPFPQAKPG